MATEVDLKVALLDTELKVLSQKVEQNAEIARSMRVEILAAMNGLKSSIDHLTEEMTAVKIERAKVEGGWWIATKIMAVIGSMGAAAWALFEYIWRH